MTDLFGRYSLIAAPHKRQWQLKVDIKRITTHKLFFQSLSSFPARKATKNTSQILPPHFCNPSSLFLVQKMKDLQTTLPPFLFFLIPRAAWKNLQAIIPLFLSLHIPRTENERLTNDFSFIPFSFLFPVSHEKDLLAIMPLFLSLPASSLPSLFLVRHRWW